MGFLKELGQLFGIGEEVASVYDAEGLRQPDGSICRADKVGPYTHYTTFRDSVVVRHEYSAEGMNIISDRPLTEAEVGQQASRALVAFSRRG